MNRPVPLARAIRPAGPPRRRSSTVVRAPGHRQALAVTPTRPAWTDYLEYAIFRAAFGFFAALPRRLALRVGALARRAVLPARPPRPPHRARTICGSRFPTERRRSTAPSCARSCRNLGRVGAECCHLALADAGRRCATTSPSTIRSAGRRPSQRAARARRRDPHRALRQLRAARLRPRPARPSDHAGAPADAQRAGRRRHHRPARARRHRLAAQEERRQGGAARPARAPHRRHPGRPEPDAPLRRLRRLLRPAGVDDTGSGAPRHAQRRARSCRSSWCARARATGIASSCCPRSSWCAPAIATPTSSTNTQRCTAVIEDMLRRYPDQWIWFHKRWKTRPLGEPRIYQPTSPPPQR